MSMNTLGDHWLEDRKFEVTTMFFSLYYKGDEDFSMELTLI